MIFQHVKFSPINNPFVVFSMNLEEIVSRTYEADNKFLVFLFCISFMKFYLMTNDIFKP